MAAAVVIRAQVVELGKDVVSEGSIEMNLFPVEQLFMAESLISNIEQGITNVEG